MIAKSTVTCDMEGIIETFNAGAEEIFGYTKEEVIGKKRVSLFSPGHIVLQNVEGWLATAVREGEFVTDTVFVRKSGEQFPAHIRITPTFRDGQQIGFCGVTEVLEKPVQVPIKFSTKLVSWLVVTRAPFLSASLLTGLVGCLYALQLPGTHAVGLNIGLAFLGLAFLHLSANVFNDYFDVQSGTDDANTQYFLKYSGGSRAIELGLITLRGTFVLATVLLLLATAIGFYLNTQVSSEILMFGIAGALSGFFYTAPPLRLSARRGLGELFIGLTFGPLISAGMMSVITGHADLWSFLIGVPPGLLTANILLINEVPDAESDAKTGKNHLVVVYGKERTPAIYTAIVSGALLVTVYLAWSLHKPLLLIPAAIGTLLAVRIVSHMRKNILLRSLVQSNVNTIILQAVFTLVMALCFLM